MRSPRRCAASSTRQRRRTKRPLKAPDAAVIDQRAGLERPGHELAQEHRVAARAPGELAHRRRVHRPPEHGGQELFDHRVLQDTHLDTFGRAVLPEIDDRVGGELIGAHGGEHRGYLGQGQLVKQSGRAVVQEMGVIDEHHQPTPFGLLDQGTGVASQQRAVVLVPCVPTVRVGGQHRREAPKGNPREAWVAAVRASDIPRSSASFRHATASVVLPTPAAPVITAPRFSRTAALN